MPNIAINYLAVLLGAVINMVIGFVWYGPLFGKKWMKLVGFTDADMRRAKEKGMGKTYLLGFLSGLVMTWVLAMFVGWLDLQTAAEGARLGLMVWFGFLATTFLSGVLWENKPKHLYLINVGYYLVSLAALGALLAVWPA